MPKLKTHKGSAKVFKARKNDYKIGTPGSRHNTGKKNAASNRKSRSGSALSNSDYKRLKNLI
ncbi:MAG: 50S ribosomal protein L35 [Bacilli bacterium]|nr:50S ribosomal protein L35 [Bacilli bacterium]